MKNILIKVGLILGITLLQIGLAFIAFKILILPTLQARSTPPAAEVAQEEPEQEIKGENDVYELPPEVKQESFLQLDNVVINPANAGGQKFLVISLFILLKDTKIDGPGSVQEMVVLDAINNLLSRRSYDWFKDPDNKDIIREEIAMMAQKIFHESVKPKVYITKFVLQ